MVHEGQPLVQNRPSTFQSSKDDKDSDLFLFFYESAAQITDAMRCPFLSLANVHNMHHRISGLAKYLLKADL